jgi:hypothetical protein
MKFKIHRPECDQPKPPPTGTKSKSKKSAKPKANAPKNTYVGVHAVCPELVNLFDYMVDQNSTGSKGVTLRDVSAYTESIINELEQLLVVYSPETALAELEDSNEFDDLCC